MKSIHELESRTAELRRDVQRGVAMGVEDGRRTPARRVQRDLAWRAQVKL
jgi:hypothetical protein